MSVTLADGRVIGVPLAWFPTLLAATPQQRAAVEIGGGGVGLHWSELDEDVSLAGLLAGAPVEKSAVPSRAKLATSFDVIKWLAEHARVHGNTRRQTGHSKVIISQRPIQGSIKGKPPKRSRLGPVKPKVGEIISQPKPVYDVRV